MIAATTVILDGDGDYLFQATSTMLTGAGCKVELRNGAQASRVVWAVGSTFKTGANNIIEGTARAGSAITIGADNDIHGSLFAITAITIGARVQVDGCIISNAALTFGANNDVNVVISENCEAMDAPTTSPAELTEIMTETTVLEATPCDTDVVLVRKIGVTGYTDIPITIISQSSPAGEVTFKISQEWAMANLSNLFVRFTDEYLAFPKCHSFDDVNANWTSPSFTAVCTRKSQIALVEVWASDDSLSTVSDVAEPPDCTCDADISTGFPMVKYVFQVECVSTCGVVC
jgi:hypothetical protein